MSDQFSQTSHRAGEHTRPAENGRGCTCAEAAGMWEISILSSQFFCEPRTGLKNKVFSKKKINQVPYIFVCSKQDVAGISRVEASRAAVESAGRGSAPQQKPSGPKFQ